MLICRRSVIWGLIIFVAVHAICQAGVIFVDDDAGGANNGSSWEDAYLYLQDALMMSLEGDEIRVAQGIYKPDVFVLSDRPNLGRAETFQLIPGITLKGGYARSANPDYWVRNIRKYVTILSGDLSDNDGAEIDVKDMLDDPTREDNCFSVVSAGGTGIDAILDGFTIRGGNANGSGLEGQGRGGGIYNPDGSLTVKNCTFVDNSAFIGGGISNFFGMVSISDCTFINNVAHNGGGMHNDNSISQITRCNFHSNVAYHQDAEENPTGGGMCNSDSTPIITDCEFIGNSVQADYHGGGDGAGMFCTGSTVMVTGCLFRENSARCYGGGMTHWGGGQSVISNCRFENNTAPDEGGAMDIYMSNPRIEDCLFDENRADISGGGVNIYRETSPVFDRCVFIDNKTDYSGAGAFAWHADPTFTNCLFALNTSGSDGAAIYNRTSNLRLVNCTLVGNVAVKGQALACGSNDDAYPGTSEIINSILWNQGREIHITDGSTITVTYSDVTGGFEGEGNIDEDPLFIDQGEEDYHLKPDSPCINKGDNSAVLNGSTDLEGNRRMADGTVDMGAYEINLEPAILYVDDDAVGDNEGSSWINAFVNLPDALVVARPGDEIRVAQGTYQPAPPDGDRAASFVIRDVVSLYGGYAGLGAADPDSRDTRRYETILSGDLNGNDTGGFDNPSRSDNSHHVVTIHKWDMYEVYAVLDGFTITGGHSDEQDWSGGAGLSIHYANYSVIRNCKFTKNYVAGSGGAIHDSGSYYWILDKCVFIGNQAQRSGGAMCLDGESMPKVTNCLFTENRARYGGAISNIEAYFTLENCTVVNNHATEYAGGMDDSQGTRFRNCIFWSNTDSLGSGEESQIKPIYNEYRDTFDNCCIQGWAGSGKGTENMGDNPLFVAPDRGDYHLKSQAGHWDDRMRSWVIDDVTSPCIDTGDPSSPIGPETFPNGGVINMGAYGGTTHASKSWFGRPSCRTIIASDINGDCVVSLADFAVMAGNWLRIASEPTIEYEVSDCQSISAPDSWPDPRFKIRIEDGYIYFEDIIRANCCTDRIVLDVQAWSQYIDINEIEYTTDPCRCMCDYPATAVLGPFESGTYLLTIVNRTKDDSKYIGTVEVIVP